MASAATNGPDSVITVKVQTWDGCTRRAKMVLRDMVPGTLEQQVRAFLCIKPDQALVIERYSDSAGSYVELDKTNMAVYKQLYRAAKAKSKLKLRVSLPKDAAPTAPRPVTVEEVPEASASTDSSKTASSVTAASPVTQSPVSAIQQPSPTPSKPIQVTLPMRSGPISRTYDADALNKAAQQLSEFETMRLDLDRRLNLIRTQKGQDKWNAPVPNDAETNTSSPTAQQIRETLQKAKVPVPPRVAGYAGLVCTRNSNNFAVCCNSCDQTMPDVHYHCSTCDEGDFDLCSSCVDQGITCHSPSHWMIKRTTVNGEIVNSTTEVIAPKIKKEPTANTEPKPAPPFAELFGQPHPAVTCMRAEPSPPCYDTISGTFPTYFPPLSCSRTCNSCLADLPEAEFLHCNTCEDFDLCKSCFVSDTHGHHPMHGFAPAVAGTDMPAHITVKMAPGRNQMHHAICDGCDKYIMGVRHKCLDCPDWDFCATCQPNAHIVHPNHRFVPIYAPLTDAPRTVTRSVHVGICCDGPLCANGKGYPSYIRGTRYKCAVCDDLDFCSNCEANPNASHNKTHPLIMFKTPIRHVNVSTVEEDADGQRMRRMGDRSQASPSQAKPAPKSPVRAASVKTEAPKPPIMPAPVKKAVEVPAPTAVSVIKPKPEPKERDLVATFVRDTVVDGTIMAPNHVFEQSWVLRNDGPDAWPAGCSVKYVGGDYMGHVDSNHPAEISKLVSASESTICYDSLAPGQEFSFTVLLRTPSRPGKFVSYWRLSDASGLKFGHRLWCDVKVRAVKVEEPKPVVKEEISVTTPEKETTPRVQTPIVQTSVMETPVEDEVSAVEEADESSVASSRMIFPKLEKESPVASMHEHSRAPSTITDDKASSAGVPDESAEDEDWDVSEDGFLTDEEYDILDASDEEFLEEQAKKLLK